MLLDLVPIKMTSSHAIINLRGNRNHDTVKQNRILAKHPRHVIEIHKHYEMLASHAISVSNASLAFTRSLPPWHRRPFTRDTRYTMNSVKNVILISNLTKRTSTVHKDKTFT